MRHQYFHLTDTLQLFQHRWQTEYLSSLQERHNFGVGPKFSLSVGDIVLVKLDNRKRSHWPLGRIVAIYPDDDGVVHSVNVLYEGEKSLRPHDVFVEHIIPLEMSACEDNEGEENDDNEHIDKVNEEEDTSHSVGVDEGESVGSC
ncbi:uncharacterized protein [Macrobrachium rosenbergii]|uniref:uncharacterized protein n=1 Tax=Macrobrachium rosenbergii TaxID=79674 RepID=UPI0034D65359